MGNLQDALPWVRGIVQKEGAGSGGSRISPRRGRQLSGECQHTILPKFPKNCMKLKEFGPRGGGGTRPKFYYVDPPLAGDSNLHFTPEKSFNFKQLTYP